MKKKILLIATMIMLFAFVLSISVFADAYDPNRTTVEYNGQSVNVITSNVTVEEVAEELSNKANMQGLFKDDNALVVLADSNGNLFAFPTWYIIEPSGSNTSYVAISEVEYAFVNTLVDGSTFEKGAIRYIEFPHGMTAVRNNNVFGQKANSSDFYEVNVTDIHIPSSVTSIEGNSFYYASSIKRVYVEKGNGIKAIPSSTFSNSSVEYVQFENLTELETIDGFTKTALKGDVDLSKTKLKTIEKGAFQNSINIGKITLPDTVETIKDFAFERIGSGYLASPYLPSSLTSVGQRFFAYNDNLLDTYIFPVGVKAIGNEPFQDSKVGGGPTGKKLDLVFLGEVTGCVYLNGNGHQKHADKVTVYFAKNSLDQYNTNEFYIKPSGSSTTSVPGAIRAVFCNGNGTGKNGSVTGIECVYITNTAGTSYTVDMVNDATYGFDFDNHTHYGAYTRVENNCAVSGSETISCIVCDQDIVEVLEATGKHNYVEGQCTVCHRFYCPSGGDHTMKVEVVYANGFTSAGVVVDKCQSEGCIYEKKIRDLAPLFECLGFSAPENGVFAITLGYKVDRNAINDYVSTTGETFDYGIFVVAKNKLGANDVVDADGNFASGVIGTSMKAREFSYYDIKIVGIETDAHKSAEIAMGTYVIVTGENGAEITYIQESDPTEGAKYSFVSYNSVTNA